MKVTVHHDGRQLGPYSIDGIRVRLGTGELFSTDLAWVEGTPDWVPLSAILSGVSAGRPALSGPYPPAGYALWQAPSTELATMSLILGLISFFCLSILSGIPAIICGHMARARAEHTPAQFGGAGRALAGLILGYFSLLPVLVALIAIVLALVENRSDLAKSTAARVQISALTMALETFKTDTASYPTLSEGLNALVRQPASRPGWKGPYLADIPQDPWGHAYVYRYPGKENPRQFELVCTGPDGLLGTADDIGPGDGPGGDGRLTEELEEPEARGK